MRRIPPPSWSRNQDAVRSVLQHRDSPQRREWQSTLDGLRSALASRQTTQQHVTNKPAAGEKKKEEPKKMTANDLMSQLTLSTGIAGLFVLLDRNEAAKTETVECFAQMLEETPAAYYSKVRDKAMLDSLDKIEKFLLDSVAHDSAGRDGCLDSLIGLALARGSLATNLRLCKLLLQKPDVLRKKHLRKLAKIGHTSTSWFSAPSVEMTWTSKVLPVLESILADTQLLKRKWPEVLAVLNTPNGHEQAIALVHAMLQSPGLASGHEGVASGHEGLGNGLAPQGRATLPESFTFPPPTSAAAPAAREEGGGYPVQFVLELEERIGEDGHCQEKEAAAGLLVQMGVLACRLDLPPLLSSETLKDPPEHIVGSLHHLPLICDLMELCVPSSSAEELSAAARLVLEALLHVLKANLHFYIRVLRQGEGTVEEAERACILKVEATLRGILLQPSSAARAGARAQQLMTNCYAEGLPLFFTSPEPLLQALKPLIHHVKGQAGGREHATSVQDGAGTAGVGEKRLAGIVISYLSNEATMLKLLLEAGSAPEGAEEQGAAGTEGGEERGIDGLRQLLDGMVQCLCSEVAWRVQSGEVVRFQRRDGTAVDEEADLAADWVWVWQRVCSRFELQERRTVSNTRGGVGMAIGGQGLKEGKHGWEVRVEATRAAQMYVGLTPGNVDIDCGAATNMVLWQADGTISQARGQSSKFEGYGPGDTLTMILDMNDEGGVLQFYKNNTFVGSSTNVKKGAAEMFPCIVLKEKGQQVSLVKAFRVSGLGGRRARGEELDSEFAVACGSAATSVVLVLNKEMERGCPRALHELGASLVSLSLVHVSRFVKSTVAHLASQGDNPDLLPILSAFDHLHVYSASGMPRHLLTWLPHLTVLASRVRSDVLESAERLVGMLDGVVALRELLSAHEAFSSYSGACFQSFALSGLQIKKNLWVKTQHDPAIIRGDWTVEVLAQRSSQCPTECEVSVLIGCATFCIQLSKSDSTLQFVDFPERDTISSFDGGMPADKWVLLSLVSCQGVLTLYRDGFAIGTVPKTTSLSVVSIGACSKRDKRSHFFGGRLREVRVWSRALTRDEIQTSMTTGVNANAGIAAPQLIACIDLTEEADGPRAAQRGQGSCEMSVQGLEEWSRDGVAASQERHWLWGMLTVLNGMGSRLAVGLVRGSTESEGEEEVEKWVGSDLLSGTLGSEPDMDLLRMPASSESEDRVQQLMLPRVGVRMSPHLDGLERTVMVAMLHHCSVLSTVLDTEPATRSSLVQATCRNVARAARAIRHWVSQQRDRAGMAVKAGAAAPSEWTGGWAECCAPLVDKCKLLLRLSPLCNVEGPSQLGRQLSSTQRSLSRQKSDSQRALNVYRRMWKQSLGTGRFKRAIDQVSAFLKSNLSTSAVVKAWSTRSFKVEQVHAGLRVLVELLSLPALWTLRDDTLAAMVSAPKADRHYLKGLVGGGAEEGVRSYFNKLVEILVGVLRERPARPVSLACSASALVMAMDQRDLSALWSTDIESCVSQYWEDPAAVCAGSGVMWCMARLTQSLVLQQGLLSRQVDAADSRRALSMAQAAVKWLCKDGVNMDGVAPKPLKLRGRLVEGDSEAKLVLNLELHEQPLSCLVVVRGDAERYQLDANGAEVKDSAATMYTVQGMSQLSTGSKVMVCMSLEPRDQKESPISLAGVLEDNTFLHGNWKSETRRQNPAEEETKSGTFMCGDGGWKESFFTDATDISKGGGVLDWNTTSKLLLRAANPVTAAENVLEISIRHVKEGKAHPEIGVGVVCEAYSTDKLPGWEAGSIAFHTDDGHMYYENSSAGETFGPKCVVGDVIRCTVGFGEDNRPKEVTWHRNDEKLGSRLIAGRLPDRLYFALGSQKTKQVLQVATPCTAPTDATLEDTVDADAEVRTAEQRRSLSGLVWALSRVGHENVVRQVLVGADWRELLWVILFSPGHDQPVRSHALQALSLSLLEPGALTNIEIDQSILLLILLVSALSPEGHVCRPPPFDEDSFPFKTLGSKLRAMSPCLRLKKEIVSILRLLSQREHARDHLTSALVRSLRSVRARWGSSQLDWSELGAVLVVGGMQEVVMGWSDEEVDNGAGKQARLHEDVVRELLGVCATVLQAEGGDGGLKGVELMLRTRLLKGLWELLGMKAIKKVVAAELGLLEQVLDLARRRGSTPLTVNDVGDETEAPTFVNEDARGRRIPGVDLTDAGRTCKIGNVDATLRIGGEMPPNTGKYYVELSIVRCKNFSCIGIGDVGSLHDVGSLLGCEFAKSGFVGWSDDNDCKVNGQWLGHSCLEQVANASSGFKGGDKVGIELDTDNGTLAWTKNGRLYVKYSRPVEKRSKFFMVSANNTSDLEVSVNVPASYASIRVGAGSGSITDGGWVTMDMLIAKTQALCLKEGAVDAQVCDFVGAPRRDSDEPIEDGLRARAQAALPGVQAWLNQSEHQVRSKLLHSSVDAFADGDQVAQRPASWGLSPWRTHGNATDVWQRTEEQLAISYARLCVLDLLASRHVEMAKLVDFRSLQDVVAPYFPKGVNGPARRFFRTGPYADLISVLDRALVGWITAMQETDAARLPRQLVALSKESQIVLQAELYEQYLIAPDGHARFCSSPSVVSWHPRRAAVALGGRGAKVESELGAGATLSMVSWVCRHLCQGYGLRSAGADGKTEAVGLARRLLEAACVLRDGSSLVTVQRALTGAVLGCDAEAAAEVKIDAGLFLQTLHRETMRYQLEDYQPSKLEVSCSPVLQSFASTVVALDLAISQHDAIAALRTLRSYVYNAESAADKPPSHRGPAAWGCLVSSKEEQRRPLESLLLLRQLLTCLREGQPLPEWLLDLARAQSFQADEFHSFDDRDAASGVRVVDVCKRAVRRTGVQPGEWAYALLNLPMQEKSQFYRFEIQAPKRAWRECVQVGAVVLDRDTSCEQREALRFDDCPPASVVWPIGASWAATREPTEQATFTDVPGKFLPGNVVGMLLSSWSIHFYVAADATQPMTLVKQVPLPSQAVGAVIPMVRMLKDGAACTVITSTPLPPGSPVLSAQSSSEHPSIALGPRAFPGRNSISQRIMDLQGAADPRWPSTVDSLLVEYAEQRAAELKKGNISALAISELFPPQPAQSASASSAAAAGGADAAGILDREPSKLPPTIRHQSAILTGETGGVRPGETIATTPSAGGVCMSLGALHPQVLKARFAILKVLNELVKVARPLVNLALYEHRQELGYLLAHSKGRIFPEMKRDALAASLHQSEWSGHNVAGEPKLTINRDRQGAAKRRRERSVFVQAMSQLEKGGHTLIPVVERSGKLMAWTVSFHGESGTDVAGLYRESIREMAAELQSTDASGLKLLVPCPNHRMARATNQDRWVPNPAARSQRQLAMFRFLGRVMGACVRSNSPIELDLPSLVWRPLVGESATEVDVSAIDEEWKAMGKTWRVRSVTSKWLAVAPGREHEEVRWDEREAFMQEMVRLRLRECEKQIAALKQGFHAVVSPLVLPLLTWRELEARVCGRPTLDVARLEGITQYDDFAGGAKHPLAVMFWKVLREMSERDRAAMLAFTCGRRRMPLHNSGEYFTLRLASEMGDGHLPMAHTCFFQLDLPAYSSAAVMREKLLYAITSCAGVDTDGAVRAGGSLYEGEVDSDTDEEEEEMEEDEEADGEAAAWVDYARTSWLVAALDGGHTQERLRMEFDDGRGGKAAQSLPDRRLYESVADAASSRGSESGEEGNSDDSDSVNGPESEPAQCRVS